MITEKRTRQELLEIMMSQRGATFSGLTYYVNESLSRQDKSYPKFDGKSHKLQKKVTTNATLNSKYQPKISRILAAKGIDFEPTTKPVNGRHYADYDKNRCIVFKDNMPHTPENAQLCYVVETHNKPTTQLFHLGEPVERKDVWNEEFVTGTGLKGGQEKAVQNSMYNNAIAQAAAAEANNEPELAQKLRETANKLAQDGDFKELEFYFRTVKLTNIVSIVLDGVLIVVED